jgi:hypothetical protein
MSLRETLNKNPMVFAGIVVVAIVICGWFGWSQMSGGSGVKVPNSAFFTVDEGKTLFADERGKLTPFDKDGKPAVRAYVFKCPDGTQTVAYLERYTEKGKAVVERYRAEQKANPGKPPASIGEMSALGRFATEVKRPGDKDWVNAASGANRMFTEAVKCKSGETPEQINP